MGSRPGGAKAPGSTTAAQKNSAARESKEQWTEWWYFNQWRFVRGTRGAAVQTGGTEAGKATASPQAELVKFLMEEGLKDKHFDPQSAACIALGKMQAGEARKELETLLQDAKAHDYVRESAALALGMIQSVASAPKLVYFAADRATKTRLRVHATIGLGLLKDNSAVPQLLQILGRQDEREVHVAAAMALGLIGDKSAAAQLVGILKSGAAHEAVRAAALTAVGKLGLAKVGSDDVYGLLRRYILSDRNDDVRRSAALVLYRFDDKGVLETLTRVARSDQDTVTRGFAMISMAEAVTREGADAKDRADARRLFEGALTGGDDKEKGFAAIALGLMGRNDRDCAVALRKGFKNESGSVVRSACAIGLGVMKDVASRQDLADVVGKQVDADLRGYCCVALGMLGDTDPQITKFLVEIVEKVNVPELKAAAALALAKIGTSQEAIAVLRKALLDKNRYFQMSAIIALGYFRDLSTAKDLMKHFQKETNAEAKAITVVALGYIGESAPTPVLKSISVDFDYLNVFLDMPAVDQIIRLF